MIFSLPVFPEKQEEDFHFRMKPSALFQFMMRAANHQFITYGPTHEELLEKDMYFVVSTMDVVIQKPIAPYTDLTVKTAGLIGRGVIFPRYFEIESNGENLVKCLGNFALLSISEKKLLKQDAFQANWELEANNVDLGTERPRIPRQEEMALMGTYPVSYSQVDQNKHLNNTYYPDVFYGFTDMEKYPTRIFIHYVKEAPLGETLTIYSSKEENKSYFRANLSDGSVCAECMFEF